MLPFWYYIREKWGKILALNIIDLRQLYTQITTIPVCIQILRWLFIALICSSQQPLQKSTHDSRPIFKPIWKFIPFEWSREQPILCWRYSSPSPAETLHYGSWISLPSFQTAHLPCQLGLKEPGTAFHLTAIRTCNPVQVSNKILEHWSQYVYETTFCTNDLLYASGLASLPKNIPS